MFRDDLGCAIEHPDPVIRRLWKLVHITVKMLAVLMTFVIIWGTLDVIWVLYQRLKDPPIFLLSINDILATFGSFMAVLIAIEILANIIVYLESEMIHLKLVLSTALMAVARKVIVLDYTKYSYQEVFALGGVILALSASYWVVCRPGIAEEVVRRHGPLDEPRGEDIPPKERLPKEHLPEQNPLRDVPEAQRDSKMPPPSGAA